MNSFDEQFESFEHASSSAPEGREVDKGRLMDAMVVCHHIVHPRSFDYLPRLAVMLNWVRKQGDCMKPAPESGAKKAGLRRP